VHNSTAITWRFWASDTNRLVDEVTLVQEWHK
jgi:hypothetical protein